MTNTDAFRPLESLKYAGLLLLILVVAATVALLYKDPIYLSTASAFAASDVLGAIAQVVTKPGLVALVVVTGLIALWSVIYNRPVVWRLVAGGVGVVLSFGISKLLKAFVTEERPCNVLEVVTVLACPAEGSWSWPSNHSVIAAAFATACVLALRKFVWVAVPVATLIGLAR